MEMTKLTIRIPVAVLERAKAYAEINRTSVTRLVSQYLDQLPVEERSYLKDAPTVQRLSGILSSETDVEDYYRYLEEKYGEAAARAD